MPEAGLWRLFSQPPRPRPSGSSPQSRSAQRIRTCRWLSWLASGTTTPGGPVSPVFGPTKIGQRARRHEAVDQLLREPAVDLRGVARGAAHARRRAGSRRPRRARSGGSRGRCSRTAGRSRRRAGGSGRRPPSAGRRVGRPVLARHAQDEPAPAGRCRQRRQATVGRAALDGVPGEEGAGRRAAGARRRRAGRRRGCRALWSWCQAMRGCAGSAQAGAPAQTTAMKAMRARTTPGIRRRHRRRSWCG